jgi:hypothetical protein
VKQRRRGPIGAATGLAEGVAAAVRRYQRGREPRVLLYGGDGIGRLERPTAPGYERLRAAVERMVSIVALPLDDPFAPDDVDGAEDEEER